MEEIKKSSRQEETEENTYVVPSESGAEMARLIDQDRAITAVLGLLPAGVELQEGDQVLDVACGPGGWIRQVALTYPYVSAVGIDISQTMTSYANAYVQAQNMHNVSFQMMNVTQKWEFADATFDVINARMLVGFLNQKKWNHVLTEMMRVLVPGGTLILTETDDTGRTNSLAHERFAHAIFQAMKKTGLSHHPFGAHFGITSLLPHFLHEVGGVDIKHEAYAIDFSAGTPAHGAIIADLAVGYKLVQSYIVKKGVATQEELDELYEELSNDWQLPDFRAIWYFLRIWGRKPEKSS